MPPAAFRLNLFNLFDGALLMVVFVSYPWCYALAQVQDAKKIIKTKKKLKEKLEININFVSELKE